MMSWLTSLGNYTDCKLRVMKNTQNKFVIWGRNPIIEALRAGRSLEKIFVAHDSKPPKELLELAKKRGIKVQRIPRKRVEELAGSTSQIIKYATSVDADRVIIVTEVGLKHTLMKINPNKEYIFPENMNYCGTVYCCTMKGITLPKVYETLKNEINEVTLPEDIIERARRPIERMLALS